MNDTTPIPPQHSVDSAEPSDKEISEMMQRIKEIATRDCFSPYWTEEDWQSLDDEIVREITREWKLEHRLRPRWMLQGVLRDIWRYPFSPAYRRTFHYLLRTYYAPAVRRQTRQELQSYLACAKKRRDWWRQETICRREASAAGCHTSNSLSAG